MRRLLLRALVLVVIAGLGFGALVTVLAVRTVDPREAPAWTRLADLPDPRGETAAGVAARVDDDACDGRDPTTCSASPVRVFVVGGLTGAGKTVDTVSIYDPDADRWSAGPSLPAVRHHPGAAGSGGVMYVSGGSTSATDWKPERTLWGLLPIESRWRTLAPMPEGRMGHAMVAVGPRLYVIGGRGETSNVLIYETQEDRWRLGAQMPRARDHLAAVAVGTRIYALGGRDDRLTDRVDVYDTASDSWSDGPALPRPMSAMAAGALDDGIHVVGGEEPATIGGGVIDEHFVLAPGADTWERAPLPIVPTHGSAAVTLDGALLIAGGARRQGALSPLGWTGITEVYRPTT